MNLTASLLVVDALKGLEFNVSTPTGIQLGRVLSNTASAIVITDPGGAVATAIGGGTPVRGAMVFAFAETVTGNDNGSVTGTPSYDSSANRTAFPCADLGSVADDKIGQWISFNGGPPLQIVDTSGVNIYVAGDFSAIVGSGASASVAQHPHSTGGQVAAISYSSGITTVTVANQISGANFAAYMIGWQVQLNPKQPTTRTIAAIPASNQLQFSGDGTNVATIDDFIRIFAPPGVQSDANGTAWWAQTGDVRFLYDSTIGWAGYRYLAPQVGYVVDPSSGPFGTYGFQTSKINVVGSYHCWNRIYSPYLGRWTTPDPARAPWWNLMDYCGQCPIRLTDPSGLACNTKGCDVHVYYAAFIPHDWLPDPAPNMHPGLRENVRFKGDDRGFASKGSDVVDRSRAWQHVTVHLCSENWADYEHGIGLTVLSYWRAKLYCTDWFWQTYEKEWHYVEETARAKADGSMSMEWIDGDMCFERFTLTGSTTNPFRTLGPSIDWFADITVTYWSRDWAWVEAKGEHDAFPAHELIANDVHLHKWDPRPGGYGPYWLAFGKLVKFNEAWYVPIDCPCCECE